MNYLLTSTINYRLLLKSRVKSQEFLFFKVFIVAANILIIDVISCSDKVNLLAGTISVSIMISTQDLNSYASFNAFLGKETRES